MLTSQDAAREKFERQLHRLKAALRIAEDQDVARRLGMSKAAFSARKMRGAFPVDRVKALAIDEPELHLDVDYVLTGVSAEVERRFAAVRTATGIAASVKDVRERYRVQEDVVGALVGALAADEQQLVSCYRQADERGKTAILTAAISLAGGSRK